MIKLTHEKILKHTCFILLFAPLILIIFILLTDFGGLLTDFGGLLSSYRFVQTV